MRTVLKQCLKECVDDMKQWPDVSYTNIVNYLVFSEGVNGEEFYNYKSTERLGRSCSHAAAIMWKEFMNPKERTSLYSFTHVFQTIAA